MTPGAVRKHAHEARKRGIAGGGGLDVPATEEIYRTLARTTAQLARKAKSASEVEAALGDADALARLEERLTKARAAAPSKPAELATSILAAHNGGPVYTPPPAPLETAPESRVVEPPSEPEPLPAPGEWMREQVAALGAPAPAPARQDARGVCGNDFTLQSFPNPTPRDRPLPKVEPERSRRRIGGGPSYAYPGG